MGLLGRGGTRRRLQRLPQRRQRVQEQEQAAPSKQQRLDSSERTFFLAPPTVTALAAALALSTTGLVGAIAGEAAPRGTVLEYCGINLFHSTCLLLPTHAAMGGNTKAHGQHNKAHKVGRHAAKGQRHKQREVKGAPARHLRPASQRLTRARPAALPGARRSGGPASASASGAFGSRAGRQLAAKQHREAKRAAVLAAKRAGGAAPKARPCRGRRLLCSDGTVRSRSGLASARARS